MTSFLSQPLDAAVYVDMSDEVDAEWDVHKKDDVEALNSEARLWFDEIPDLSEQDLSQLTSLQTALRWSG